MLCFGGFSIACSSVIGVMKTVFPVHRFPVASSFKRILLSAAVCISDEALYAVVDPFDDFECIGFVKNSSLLFIRN